MKKSAGIGLAFVGLDEKDLAQNGRVSFLSQGKLL